MKNRLLVLTGFLFTGLLLLTSVTGLYAQTKNPEVLMSFERQRNGKVVQLNVAEQKIFAFTIQGLTTQADVDNFTSKFTNKKMVISIKIGDMDAAGHRKGSILLDATSKLPDFQELLKGAGINSISIDGELKSTDELGKDKKEGNK